MKLLLFILFLFLTISGISQLYNYSSFTAHFDTKKWTEQYSRTLDSSGILIQKKEYHALSIAAYGVMNYRDFVNTGDSSCYYHVINQYKYFCDSSKIVYIDDYKGMGLPYKFKFHDLKQPWYSGMTQGFAISFLLRYYELTKDPEALKKVQQLAYFMLRPEKDGGTIGTTPEGYTFIEEYPNSKRKPQVLNGFINGLIGIKEYLNYFPDDTLAKRIHDESYTAMILTFNAYDTPNWTSYDRKKSRCSNQYMRYELTELEQLYAIYEDDRIIKQMMIWSYFAFNKLDKTLKFYRNPKYQYAVPLQNKKDSISTNNTSFDKMYEYTEAYTVLSKRNKKSNVIQRKKESTIYLDKETYSIILFFKNNVEKLDFSIETNGEKPNVELDSNKITISSGQKFKEIKIQFKSKKIKKIKVKMMKQFDHLAFSIPRYGFYKLSLIYHLTENEKYAVRSGMKNIEEGYIFYRYSKEKTKVKKEKYDLNQIISLNENYFTPLETGYYEFFISVPFVPGVLFKAPKFSLK